MVPESVEIKVTLADSQVVDAVGRLDLQDDKSWTVVFCEDVTRAAEATGLLDVGLVLRARGKSGAKGDSTIKLRPCRWSQLHQDFFENSDGEEGELKIEADWAGAKRVLATSMTTDWTDSRLSSVLAGQKSVAELFSARQLTFLDKCGQARVNLAAVTALSPIAATRWATFEAGSDGTKLEVRAERWQVDELDFLELSVVSVVEQAEASQKVLTSFVTDLGLQLDDNQDSKTRRVLSYLITRQ